MTTGKYTPIIKKLDSAVPTIRKSDGVVLEWKIRTIYRYDGDSSKDLPAWENDYVEHVDVSHTNKTPEQFTKTELIGYMNPKIDELHFDNHYEMYISSLNPPSKDYKDFDVSVLPD